MASPKSPMTQEKQFQVARIVELLVSHDITGVSIHSEILHEPGTDKASPTGRKSIVIFLQQVED